MIVVNRAGEEIDGDQLLGMIVQKGTPSLRRRLTAADHVFADAAFPTLIPSLSNSPWMRGAPQVGFSRHILRIRSRTSQGSLGFPNGPAESSKPRKDETFCGAWRRRSQVERWPAPSATRSKRGATRPTADGPVESTWGAFWRSAEARRFDDGGPGSPAQGQHATARSKAE
jgi:hypothetical protein